jgi:hypothetical protein
LRWLSRPDADGICRVVKGGPWRDRLGRWSRIVFDREAEGVLYLALALCRLLLLLLPELLSKCMT